MGSGVYLRTEKMKEKMSLARKRFLLNQEKYMAWKEKISSINKGNKYSSGYKHSESWKKEAVLRQRGIPKDYNKGKRPANYIDGRSNLQLGSLYGSMWKGLRKSVKERDNYTCQYCQRKDRKLHLHHLIPIKNGGKNVIENLITTCVSCHKKEELKLRKKNEW